MIRAILAAFASAVNVEIGLTPTAAKPVFGLPVATVPSATIGVAAFGPGEESRISDGAAFGRTLSVVLTIFAASDAKLLDYVAELDTLYAFDGLIVAGVEVDVRWGQAVLPEPDAEMDKTLHYQIQQPVTFSWGL